MDDPKNSSWPLKSYACIPSHLKLSILVLSSNRFCKTSFESCNYILLSICRDGSDKFSKLLISILCEEHGPPTWFANAHWSAFLTLFQLLNPSTVNIRNFGGFFSKRKHGKQNASSFDSKYSSHGNSLNQEYINLRFWLQSNVFGYFFKLGWQALNSIYALWTLSCSLMGYDHIGRRNPGSRSKKEISTCVDLNIWGSKEATHRELEH